MASGEVVTKTCEDGSRPGYVILEEVMKAMTDLRKVNKNGYKKHLDNAGLLPYKLKDMHSGVSLSMGPDPGEEGKTNCSLSTLNAFMVGLARSCPETSPVMAGATRYEVPILASAIVPNKLAWIWNLNDKRAELKDLLDVLHQGAALAMVQFNLGVRVKAHFLRRGDVIQINWQDYSEVDKNKWDGHSVLCYHVRRIPNGETRFMTISAQETTFGVGANVNERSRLALPAVDAKRLKNPLSEDLEGPSYVRLALSHGHWYVVTSDVDDAEHGAGKTSVNQGKGGFYRAQVVRPHRAFPHFPIVLPRDLTATHVLPKSLRTTAYSSLRDIEGSWVGEMASAYYANNEGGTGGFFPIGATRTWHGGIHLYPEAKKDGDIVYAPFDGRIVCARLAPDDEESKKKWTIGSPNFILLQHRMHLNGEEVKFYSLLMHLAQDSWADWRAPLAADPRFVFPWLRDILLAPTKEYAALFKPQVWKKLHLQVVNKCKLTDGEGKDKKTVKELEPSDILQMDPSKPEELQAWYGRKLGGKASTLGGDSGTLEAKQSDLKVLDLYPIRFTEIRDKLAKGEVVNLWNEEILVSAGEPIGRVGTLGRADPKPTLHFEIFSEEFIKCWVDDKSKVVKDDKTNLFFDRQAFLDRFFKLIDDAYPENAGAQEHMVGTGAKKGDGVITREEVIEFFNHSAEREQFRELVTRHPSEWSDEAQWDKLDKNAKDVYGFLSGEQLNVFKDQIAPYVWWNKDLDGAGLPKNKCVYHYHPIRFLMWIDFLRWKDAKGGGMGATDLHFSIVEDLQKSGW
jgi:hypothetical protein